MAFVYRSEKTVKKM